VFTMFKILRRITARSKVEGLAVAKKVNRSLIAYLTFFVLYLAGIMFLKAEIFRHPNQTLNSNYSDIEKTYLAA